MYIGTETTGKNHSLEVTQKGLIGIWTPKGVGVFNNLTEVGIWELGFIKQKGKEVESMFKK